MDNPAQKVTNEFPPIDYLKITILGFGISAFWSSLHSIVLPIRLLDFVPETQKSTYLGYLTFTGLVLAGLTQPIIGRISDRSRFSFGRRRPFILVGILLAIIVLPGISFRESFIIIVASYCFMQVAVNTAQSSYQSFIPDLVPEGRKGSASGIKTLVEFTGGFTIVRLVAFFMDRYSPDESQIWLWVTLILLGIFLLVPMIITIFVVKEKTEVSGQKVPVLSGLHRSFQINLGQNHEFIWFLLSRGLMSIPGTALLTYFLYFVIDVFEFPNPAGVTANVLIVVGLSLVTTAYFAGRLSDRLGRKSILAACGFIGALGMVFLFLSQNQIHLMLSGVLIGIANGAFWSTSWAQATDLLPEGESARFMALTNTAAVAGSGLARLIGPAIDFFNTIGPNFGYSVMFIIGIVCYFAGSLVILKIKETKLK